MDDQLRKIWEDQNQKLNRSIELNTTLLQKINSQNVRRQLLKPLIMEILNAVFTFTFVVYLASVSLVNYDLLQFSIPGIVSAIAGGVLMTFSIIRARRLYDVDAHADDPVVNTQKRFLNLLSVRNKLGIVEIVVSGIALVFMWPIVIYTGFDTDIYQNGLVMLAFLGISIAISVPVAILVERYYREKLRNTDSLLTEIHQFESE